MSRFYLYYRVELKEPLILSNGSQIGNVLLTQDHIPGSTMLGLCAGLYLRSSKKATGSDGQYEKEFKDLFLSDDTVFSPAYPLGELAYQCFPIPMSVLGCKHFGFNRPDPAGDEMHGFSDYLKEDKLTPDCCAECGAALEHKSGFLYSRRGKDSFFNHDVSKQILTHNKVSDEEKKKRLFSFECITPGQQFYGEISFQTDSYRKLIKDLLAESGTLRLGKARNRGYGLVQIHDLIEKENSVCSKWAGPVDDSDKEFFIYFYSDAIPVDKTLRYCSSLDSSTLAFWLELEPDEVHVANGIGDPKRSFYRQGRILGFNQTRKMPLPFEQTISAGSVFSCSYKGNHGIKAKLAELEENGIGLRRNEGFGRVIINHRIHQWKR